MLLLDQGSHACKASVRATDGRVLSTSEVAVATRTDARQPTQVEYDAEALVAAMQQAMAQTWAQLPGKALPVRAAGLATQRSTIACWDRRDGRALAPVISWQDRRNADWLAALAPDPGRIRRITGLLPSAHYGASKLRWCLDHLPEVRRAHAQGHLRMGPVSSFLLQRLLREQPCVVDPANASRTLLWDRQARDWSPALLREFGIPRECLPDCVPSRYAYGHLAGAAGGVPLRVCTGDQAAALFAAGQPDPGTLYVNVGTGAFLQRACGGHPPETPGLLCSVAWQDSRQALSVLEGTVNGAGAAISWLAERTGTAEKALLDAAADWLEGITAPPLFINGVGGLGAPWWDARCPVRFEGEHAGGLAAQAVAVIESIVFLLMVNVEAMSQAAGVPQRIIISGGVSRLDGLCQRLADLTGLQVLRPEDVQATTVGLHFLLAGTVVPWEHAAQGFEPVAAPALAARYQHWRRALDAARQAAV